jgi:hypothetical protein
MMLELQPEVFLTAYVAYAAIVMAVILWNAWDARRISRRLDEARPGRHVLHEGRAQALIGQVFGGDR